MAITKRPSTESLAEIPEIDVSGAHVVGRGLGTHRRFELRTLRAALGKSQKDVAHDAEMDQGDVSRLEGREDMRLSTLERYARALGGHLQVAVVVGGRQYLLDVGDAPRGAGRPAEAAPARGSSAPRRESASAKGRVRGAVAPTVKRG